MLEDAGDCRGGFADDAIAVMREDGESARARARAYLHKMLALRSEGLARLRESMGWTDARAPMALQGTRMSQAGLAR
jgi:serine kinase of HPr protein (carbohydrate metabolism regulator)